MWRAVLQFRDIYIYIYCCRNHLSGAAALLGAELFLRNLSFFGRSHLSKAAALPGVELFLRNQSFWEEATCLGQLRCLAQTFLRNQYVFEEATCLGQLRCLGQNFFSGICRFLEEATCLAGAELFLRNQFLAR